MREHVRNGERGRAHREQLQGDEVTRVRLGDSIALHHRGDDEWHDEQAVFAEQGGNDDGRYPLARRPNSRDSGRLRQFSDAHNVLLPSNSLRNATPFRRFGRSAH